MYTCIFPLEVPPGRVEWVEKCANDYVKAYDCNPTREFLQNEIYEHLKCDELSTEYFVLDLSFEEALEWACSDSFEVYMNFRGEKNVCPPNLYSPYNGASYCTICMCQGRFGMVQTCCGCVYHRSCLLQAYEHSKRCAVCRQDLNPYEAVEEVLV